MTQATKRTLSHRITMTIPHHGDVLISEEFPIQALRERHYCKYCYCDHAGWHLMDRKAYLDEDQPGRVLLCGRCEHTSLFGGEDDTE